MKFDLKTHSENKLKYERLVDFERNKHREILYIGVTSICLNSGLSVRETIDFLEQSAIEMKRNLMLNIRSVEVE